MKKSFWAGLLLTGLGLFLLCKNIVVNMWGFHYHFTGSSGILIVLLIAGIIAMVVKPCKVTYSIFTVLSAFLLLSVILSIRIHLRMMSFFDLLLIIATLGTGIGILVKSILSKK